MNKFCSYPALISWVIGALILNFITYLYLSNSGVIDMDLKDVFYIFLPVSLLGYFLGVFLFFPFVRVKCEKYNGAPLKVGDEVRVLSGPRNGEITRVYEIVIGQGGWELARLDLGHDKSEYTDIFEQYEVVKL